MKSLIRLTVALALGWMVLLWAKVITASLLTLTATMVCSAPCDVQVRLSVEPARDNQKVTLVMEAEDSEYYRASELPLNERSPKTTTIRYPEVPVGTYTLTAQLVKHDGETKVAAIAVRTVVVR